ncbi:MAG: DEAD/DEAH box helicase [Thermoplasmataceae archaeon]
MIAGAVIKAAVAKGSRVLGLVHRVELMQQLSERLTREGVEHGILMGDQTHSLHRPVIIASIQTLMRRTPPPADLILIDEGHHATSASYVKAIGAYPKARCLGLSASPWRADGVGLADVFDGAVLAAEPAQLMADGWLCGYRGWSFQAPSLEGVETRGGDFDEHGLSLAYAKSAVFGDVIARWQEHAGPAVHPPHGLQTIVFAASVENSLALVSRFHAIGVTAEHVDYRTADIDRFEILQRVRSGATRVVACVSLLTEGVDLPSLSCAVLARPTQSLALHLQMLGRCLRPDGLGPDGRNLSKQALILDHAENCKRHGLPDAPRDYSLTASKPKPAPVRTCTRCLAIFEAWVPCPQPHAHLPRCARVCPICAEPAPIRTAIREGPAAVDEHEAVPLDRLSKAATRREQVAAFEALLAEARSHGRKPGWAMRRFVERFPGAAKPWGAWRAAVDKETRTWRAGA